MKRAMLSLFAVALLTLVVPAGAASAQGASGHVPDDDGWTPIKHLEFTDEDVQGGVSGPEGEPIIVVPRADQPSLIEIRTGFEAEVVKTMENM